MSCLTVNISRIGKGIQSKIALVGESIKAIDSIAGHMLSATVSDVGHHLTSEASRVDVGLSVKCSVVCTLDQFIEWLDVSPEEVQWITDDTGVFFDVKSNVDWIIVTS